MHRVSKERLRSTSSYQNWDEENCDGEEEKKKKKEEEEEDFVYSMY